MDSVSNSFGTVAFKQRYAEKSKLSSELVDSKGMGECFECHWFTYSENTPLVAIAIHTHTSSDPLLPRAVDTTRQSFVSTTDRLALWHHVGWHPNECLFHCTPRPPASPPVNPLDKYPEGYARPETEANADVMRIDSAIKSSPPLHSCTINHDCQRAARRTMRVFPPFTNWTHSSFPPMHRVRVCHLPLPPPPPWRRRHNDFRRIHSPRTVHAFQSIVFVGRL
jgi:hypothetical protein